MIDIENTQARLLVGPPIGHEKLEHGEVRFLPGMNHVLDDAWEQTKNMGSVPKWIELGWLKVHGEQPGPVEVEEGITVDDAVFEISKMSAQDAVAVIEQGHLTAEMLDAVAKRDNREAVSLAAKLKLDEQK
jgi:hypothetical protein